MAELEQSLPPKNQAIKNLIRDRYDGNVSAFCRELDMKDTQRINRLFSIDKRNGKYPTPSTDILELISNKLNIPIDELFGIHLTNVFGDNNFKGNIKKGVDTSLVDKFLTEIGEQRKVAQKAQEHVDRLIDLLEKIQGK
ncbi:MAG: hypothetical protein IKP99_03825 [Bacteroidales bacterium]|jgi:hypothetical protein|nr:hypothetical protein [Bacteroidales bacterium]MBR4349831.1 hypothetical protein [Bacteroidales bacterium]MBR6265340.1 hypothetical protein [Bacteroidales bacterium]